MPNPCSKYKGELGGMRVLRSTITPFCQRNALKFCPLASIETPLTCPLLLIAQAALTTSPVSVPRSVITPFCHKNACWTVSPGRSEAPTTWPLSLIAKAAPSGSPGYRGRASILPAVQMTGLNCRTWGEGQFGSGMLFSAHPPASPRSLISSAWPLLPPSVSSGVITPFCQRKPRQTRLVPKPQKSSPLGSDIEVSARPAPCNASLGPANDWLFGPPRVPRSVMTPFFRTNACVALSPGMVENPSISPRSLIP